MSRFQILRLDDPTAADQHLRLFWRVNGRTFRVHAWSLTDWRLLPSEERPSDACHIPGACWFTARPMEVSEAAPDESQTGPFRELSQVPFSNQ
jgi:hypothetical protein